MALPSIVILGLIWSFIIVPEMVHCGYIPLESALSRLTRDDYEAFRFPDDVGNTGGDCTTNRGSSNFLGRINILEDSNITFILRGAAEALYMLDVDTLRCRDSYEWLVDPQNVAQCLTTQADVSGCFNYLSVYERFPYENETRLLLCGSQAGIRPLCRTLEIRNGSFGNATAPSRATRSLISVHPEFNGFGEFREYGSDPSSDTTFFSAGFYEELPDGPSIARDRFTVIFHEITYDNQSEVLTLRERLKPREVSAWLNGPVQFQQYIKRDFGPNLQLFYIFLRERDISDLSLNDRGRQGIFTSFTKANIACHRPRPQTFEFYSGIEFTYDRINSVIVSEGGRYFEKAGWRPYMYGSFSGNILGPRGTAICVYTAFTEEDFRGLVGVFRNDIVDPHGNIDQAIENNYFECNNDGRPENLQDFTTVNKPITQFLTNPVLILDGYIASKMVLDRTCIVMSDDRTRCINQDTLFLGTDNGRIVKIVWSTVTIRIFDPIISEELLLDDDSEVTDMVVRVVNNKKRLFVSTSTKLYSLPMERCHRFQGCRPCIRVRDPHCVWNNISSRCESAQQNNISTDGSGVGVVPNHIWQSIHTGKVADCEVLPECTVVGIAVDHETIRCMVGCNETTTTGITTRYPYDSSTPCEVEFGLFHRLTDVVECKDFKITNGLGLHTYGCTALEQFSTTVTTKPGPPANYEDNVYVSCGQTSCEVCVQELDLTDTIYSYSLQLQYTIGNSGTIFSPVVNFRDGNGCIFLSNLPPGNSLSYSVKLRNSVALRSSTTRNIQLQDGSAGPVRNIIVLLVTDNSMRIQWTEPSVINGTLSGYSIYVNGSSELLCASGEMATERTFTNLLPYTNYTIEIRACNGDGESSQSAAINVQTDCGIPSVVTNAVAVSDSNTLTFRWNTPQFYNGDVSQELYDINYVCYDVVKDSNDNIIQQGKSYSIPDGILPRTICCAEINAINTCETRTLVGLPISICGRFKDIIPGVVENLEVDSSFVGINSFVVTWNHPRNYNSPDLAFTVSVTDRSDVRIYQTFIFLTDLESCTEFIVGVTPENAMLNSAMRSNISVMTLPGLPPPPENVAFMYSFSEGLSLSWDMSDMECLTQNITNFKVGWSCGFQPNRIVDVPSSNFSISVNLTSDVNFGLCYAVVQSCDNFMVCGPYAEEVTVEVTEQPPPQPQCFLHVYLDLNVTVSFLFPSPFVPSDLDILWSLSNLNTSDVENGMYTFNVTLGNVVDIPTESSTEYVFQLYACNVYDCGSFCTLNFSTSVVPLAPTNIVIQNGSSTGAVMTWDHYSTRDDVFSFSISITSSCPTVNPIIKNIIGNKYVFRNLCPNSVYTVSVRVIDRQFSKSSVYSNFVEFFTDPGVPSAPRYVQQSVNWDTKELVITWHTPSMLNAVIIGYEVKWSFEEPCSTDSKLMSYQTDADEFQYKVTIDNPEDIQKFFVCVRARTSNNVGSWGISDQLTPSGLYYPQANGDCNTLIIVACIAVISVLSSVLMVCILSLSVCQCKCFVSGETKRHSF